MFIPLRERFRLPQAQRRFAMADLDPRQVGADSLIHEIADRSAFQHGAGAKGTICLLIQIADSRIHLVLHVTQADIPIDPSTRIL